MRTIAKDTRVEFVRKHHIERYGLTGIITQVQVVESRPYGTRTTLVDILTDTGIELQWPLSQVRRDTYTADEKRSQ